MSHQSCDITHAFRQPSPTPTSQIVKLRPRLCHLKKAKAEVEPLPDPTAGQYSAGLWSPLTNPYFRVEKAPPKKEQKPRGGKLPIVTQVGDFQHFSSHGKHKVITKILQHTKKCYFFADLVKHRYNFD